MLSFEVDWWPKRLVCGAGSIERLPDLVASLGRSRALVLCGRTISTSDLYERIRQSLGSLYAGGFHDIAMHSPLPILEKGAAYARSVSADVLISIGGGSAIDSGKGISLIHAVGSNYLDYALGRNVGSALALPDLPLAHIAIPTTTGSGSEVVPTCGLRDPGVGHKRIFRDDKLIPAVAILDPCATTATSATLTAASGMTAVARCIEAMYSGRRSPIRTALALHALRMMIESLPRTISDPGNLDSRAACLVAASMSAIAANVNVSAVHAIGHIVGGRYGLQHGLAHAILLGPSMRFMLPIIGNEQKLVLAAMNGGAGDVSPNDAGIQASELMTKFVAKLPLPQRLGDVGVHPSDIPDLAEHASHDPILTSSANNLTKENIETLLGVVL